MTRRKKVIWAAAILGVLVLVPVITHYRAKAAAEKYRTQLRAQGEKFSIDELVPLPPLDTPNGARAFLDALSRLTSWDAEIQPGVTKMVQPGHARITWQQPTLPTDKSEDIWPALRAHLETNRAALADLRQAIQQPVLHFQVNYHQGFNALLPHLARSKSASQRLLAATVMAMHEGRTEEAFANLQALVALPARYREEPFVISQLVRCAIVAIAASATWEVLQYPHWSEERLGQLQSAWEAVQTIPQMERALTMERACVLVEYEKARESLTRFDSLGGLGGTSSALQDLAEAGNQLMTDPAEGFASLIERFPLRWGWKWWNCYHDETWYLQAVQRSLDAARGTTNGQPFVPLQDKVKAEARRIGDTPPQFLLARLLAVDVSSKVVEKSVVAETQCRVALTAVALKRFERRFGKRPTDLNALVPMLLPAVPLDPMDGQSLRYRLSDTNSFLLYSVGLDGVDDGGDVNPKEPNSRSFFWTQCKDFVWPQPATAEQLREFNAQLEQKRAGKPARGGR